VTNLICYLIGVGMGFWVCWSMTTGPVRWNARLRELLTSAHPRPR
jgi:hypothetical protein